jgi:hypothetical protein
MKRPTPHFVVEVRRQRRSTTATGKSWLDDPRFAEAAAGGTMIAPIEFEPRPTLPESQALRPAGRILQSLAEAEPVAEPEAEEPPRKRRRRAEFDEQPAVRRAPASERKAHASERKAPTPEPEEAKPEAIAPEPIRIETAARAKAPAPRKVRKPAAAAHVPAPQRDAATVNALAHALAARAVSEVRTEPAAELSQADRAEARQARHRRILERYVHGAELKPGQRWKGRLQRGRK